MVQEPRNLDKNLNLEYLDFTWPQMIEIMIENEIVCKEIVGK